jgi:hypothetical protein
VAEVGVVRRRRPQPGGVDVRQRARGRRGHLEGVDVEVAEPRVLPAPETAVFGD